MQSVAEHYDALASQRNKFFERNRYYHNLLAKQYRSWIPSGSTVLEVGCGTGDLLNAVCPAGGVGVDLSPVTIEVARQRFPNLNLASGSVTDLPADATFDYIILPGTLGEAEDVQALLEDLRKHCHADTRIIVQYH
ncbi:MAG: class I SAM-dependent methyltransferase, partial [Chloroflexi bacterium]|nr:class I SAM-dependent methyltransferase [Chloroflexota bacterium]